nr:hypothetical protein [uncultured Desulfovibrio sp.]
MGGFDDLRKELIELSQMYSVNKAVERFNGDGDIPCVIFFAKKNSGYAVDPRITPGICCRKYGNFRHAAKVDQTLHIAALRAKRWILVGNGPCSADIAAEDGKFAVKFRKAVAMQFSALRDIGKRRINAFKFHRAQIDDALPKSSNAMNGEHCGKIDTIRKPKAILFFYFIQSGNICRK